MTRCGWRQMTPGLHFAEKIAREEGVNSSILRSSALVAFKKAAPYLGVSQGDVQIIDTLMAFSKDCDWEEGERPVVWPSNQLLMERCALGLRSLQRHLRALSERGLIAFKDSPNGQRYGRRGDEGRIIEAYGFDLSPLAVRAQEFEDLYYERSRERQLCQHLKRTITILRRSLRMRIESALEQGFEGDWAETFKVLINLIGEIAGAQGRDSLQALKTRFEALQSRVHMLYDKALTKGKAEAETSGVCEAGQIIDKPCSNENNQTNMTPMNDSYVMPIQTTNQLLSVNCNDANASKTSNSYLGKSFSSTKNRPIYPLMLLEACPTFADFIRKDQPDQVSWPEIARTAGNLRSMMGISPDAWNCARSVMGAEAAAISLAITLEKHTSGEVRNPGGYLRGMTDKAEAGQLYLSKSLFGRVNP